MKIGETKKRISGTGKQKMVNKQKHIHKFNRHIFDSGNKMFFCVLPDCTFKVKTALSLGKRSICNRCGNDFIMNEYSIRLAKPHCDECHKSKDAIKSPIISTVINDSLQVPVQSLAERLRNAIGKSTEDEEI
jgi:ribosomal protein S27AE